MTAVSRDDHERWKVMAHEGPGGLVVILLKRTYVLPWSRSLYAVEVKNGGERSPMRSHPSQRPWVHALEMVLVLLPTALEVETEVQDGGRNPQRFAGGGQLPTRILEREVKSPNTFSSHKTTAMTTTAFRMFLMDPCIGM